MAWVGDMQAMGAMNKQMNMPALQKIMRDFEMQNERMEMTSEVMGDAIDDAFEVPLPSTTVSSCCGLRCKARYPGPCILGGRLLFVPACVW